MLEQEHGLLVALCNELAKGLRRAALGDHGDPPYRVLLLRILIDVIDVIATIVPLHQRLGALETNARVKGCCDGAIRLADPDADVLCAQRTEYLGPHATREPVRLPGIAVL